MDKQAKRLELAGLLYQATTQPTEAVQLALCDRYASMDAADIRWAERYTRSCLVAQELAA